MNGVGFVPGLFGDVAVFFPVRAVACWRQSSNTAELEPAPTTTGMPEIARLPLVGAAASQRGLS